MLECVWDVVKWGALVTQVCLVNVWFEPVHLFRFPCVPSVSAMLNDESTSVHFRGNPPGQADMRSEDRSGDAPEEDPLNAYDLAGRTQKGKRSAKDGLRGDYLSIFILLFLYVLQGIPLGLAGRYETPCLPEAVTDSFSLVFPSFSRTGKSVITSRPSSVSLHGHSVWNSCGPL